MSGKCPVCGAPMESDVCGYCGYREKKIPPVSDDLQTGAGDRTQVIINNSFTAVPGYIPGISRKSRTVALLLCIFVGWLGCHRFYVGKIGTGLMYLFTCGFFGIGILIDLIAILTGSFRDQFGLLLKRWEM